MGKRSHYCRIYGTSVVSDIPLVLFSRIKKITRAEVRVKKAKHGFPRGVRWIHRIPDPKNQDQCRFGRKGRDFFVEFPQLCRFQIRSDGRQLVYFPELQTTDLDIAALILTQAFPLILHLMGAEVLHCCAIEMNGRAYAFLGPQGQGKSTLAAAFWRHDLPLLTDDALSIERRHEKFWAIPAIAEIRLFPKVAKRLLTIEGPDAQSAPALAKIRTRLKSGFWSTPLPLGGLIFLKTSRKLQLRPIHPSQAFPQVLSNSFRLDLNNPERLHTEFENLVTLLSQVPCYSLEYPRGFVHLDRVVGTLSVALKEKNLGEKVYGNSNQ